MAEHETSQQTADLCVKLFVALGVEDVSLNDIDIAHRMPSRVASNIPNVIVWEKRNNFRHSPLFPFLPELNHLPRSHWCTMLLVEIRGLFPKITSGKNRYI